MGNKTKILSYPILSYLEVIHQIELSGRNTGKFQVVAMPTFKRSSVRFLQLYLHNLPLSHLSGVCIYLLPNFHSGWYEKGFCPSDSSCQDHFLLFCNSWLASTSIQLPFILMSFIHLILIVCLASYWEHLSSACCHLHPQSQTLHSDLAHFSSGWFPSLLFGSLFIKYH